MKLRLEERDCVNQKVYTFQKAAYSKHCLEKVGLPKVRHHLALPQFPYV